MIARVWQARTANQERAADYHRVFDVEVLDRLRGLAGFHGAYLLARPGTDAIEITTVTMFDSLAVVKHFAGEDYARERVTPAARAALLDSDPAVRHYDVLTAYCPL